MPAPLEVRSEEIQEIMGAVPNRLIRWGSATVLVIVIGMVTASFYIEFPQTVALAIKISAQNPSQLYVAPDDLNLGKVWAHSNQIVGKNDSLFSYSDQKQNHKVVTSPGIYRVEWLRPLTSGAFLEKNSNIMVLVDTSGAYIGQGELAGELMAGVRKGQPVHIQLDAYPSHEFGSVTGQVYAISPILKDKKYGISFFLPQGLQTTRDKISPSQSELTAQAEIIIKRRQLFWQFFSH